MTKSTDKDVLWEAIYMPGDGTDRDPSKTGFKTYEEAWDFASEYFCKECKRLYDNDEGSPCDAEWMVDIEETE